MKKTIFTILALSTSLFAQEEIPQVTQTMDETKVEQSVEITPPEPKKKDLFISLSKSDRENDAITVSAMAEVEYDNSVYQTLQIAKKFNDEFSIGLIVELDEDAEEVLGYAGAITTDKWFYSIEQSKLSGRIVEDDVSRDTIVTYKDNKYLDIKILRVLPDDSAVSPSIGFQYLSYERPSVFRIDSRNYIDPKMKVQFFGFGMELDSVKRKLFNNNVKSGNDWYFYNTTMMGWGMIETSDETQFIGINYTYSSPTKETPSKTSWSGFGLNGEYELGYVRYQRFEGIDFAFKMGYTVVAEGPVSFTGDTFNFDTESIEPTEQLISYGVNFTLMTIF